jgi:hypothetical protein
MQKRGHRPDKMPLASVSDSQQTNGRHIAFAKGCGYGRMELVALQAQFLLKGS